jgi:hypothetical protein
MKVADLTRQVFLALALLYICCNPVSAQTVTAGAVATDEERIRVDGKLDERAWQKAKPIGRLNQVVPNEGESPTEETDVRVLYDADNIYFGIICYDRDPSAIVSTQLTRDAGLDVDDNIAIALDTFFDQRNGFLFQVNPSGARTDAQVSNNTDHLSYEWDGIWNAASRITDRGWEAEIAIPFKTLRFKPGQATWGLNIERQIKRHNETDRWAGAKRSSWVSNFAEAGKLENMPDVRQGKGLDIRPYGLVKNSEGDWKAEGGIDISQNLTPNLNASLTVNTDFAETEADTRIVNLTRFSTFYPEKRPFFLEGAGVFELAGTPLTSSSPDVIPFFSRRIGLYRGQEVPVIAGGKITGRVANYNIGFLDVETDESDALNLNRQNLLAARVSRNFWRQSFAGAIVTRGNPSGEGGNSLIGADAHLATSKFRDSKNLTLDMFLFRTDDEKSDTTDYAGGFRVDYPNDLWDTSFSFKQIGNNFQPALGYVRRRGVRLFDGGLSFNPRPERAGVRVYTIEFRPEIFTDLDNVVQNWLLEFTPVRIEFDSGDSINFTYAPEFERLPEPFEISQGINISAGEYTWNRYSLSASTASKRPWVLDTEYGWGEFYNGTRRQISMGLKLKPSKNIYIAPSVERHDINLKQGNFITQLFSLRADYNFSPNISWSNLVQYDNESRILGLQSRFRWILRPGNDIFLVLNRGWYRNFDHSYTSSFDRGTIKLAYTFRF